MRSPDSHARSQSPKTSSGIEWIGGIFAMPARVHGEGEPYRPEALFWTGADGAILGSAVAKPGELLAMASESLQSAMDSAEGGRSERPSRVRVASAELAEALRVAHPGLDVVCAPTPELDEMVAMMRETIGEDHEESYLSPEITPEIMSSLFGASAVLFRAEPWEQVPDDQSLFSVTIETLDVHGAALSVIGQMGESFGVIMFSSLDDFEAYLDGVEAMERGGDPEIPPHLALTFERGDDLASGLRNEITEHRWEVAGATAHPYLMAIEDAAVVRPPTGREVAIAEAVALALSEVLADDEKRLRDAWGGGEPVSHTLSVTTHLGETEITLSAPFQRARVEFDPCHDLVADLAALRRDDGEIDFDAREALEDELVRRFVASPEAKGIDGVFACRVLMDLAANYMGHTIATLGALDLQDVLFGLFPRKVSIEAERARTIVEDTRAFYTFLKREFGLEQADSCLRVLDGDAAEELEAALSDRRNFGMAKSMFMGGAGGGSDAQANLGGGLLPPIPIPGPPRQPPSRKATKAEKDKRKAARKARKRNR